MRSPISSLLLVLSVCALVAQEPAAAPGVPAAPGVAPDAVVLSAEGGIKITRADFEAAVESLPPEYQQVARGPGKRRFAQDLLRMKVLAGAGLAAGLEQQPQVAAQLAVMRENVLASAQLDALRSSLAVSEADLRAAYESSKAEFEFARARHFLIAFRGSPAARPDRPELTEEQAKARAEELRAKIAAGAAFADVAKAESDDTGSAAEGGSLGEFGRGQMVPEFEEAAFGTPLGQMSPVFRTQFGYHVVQVDERGTRGFDDVRDQLARAESDKRLRAAVEKLTADAKPVFDSTYFGN